MGTTITKAIAATLSALTSLALVSAASAEIYQIKVPLKSSATDYSNFQQSSKLTGLASVAPFAANCTLHATKADAQSGANPIPANFRQTGNSVGGSSFGSANSVIPLSYETQASAPIADGWRCEMVISGSKNRVGSFVANNGMKFTVKDCIFGSFQPNDQGAHCP